ncbi:hypothetical protein BURMUCGD1_1401 [Burkholderia multivorans CGD1]|nr:hypothetical protein BURMUCGD1_1401 [Burkholderia multivorans CGD1]
MNEAHPTVPPRRSPAPTRAAFRPDIPKCTCAANAARRGSRSSD